MNDLQSFAIAFGIVWMGLAGYLIWLDARVRKLEKR